MPADDPTAEPAPENGTIRVIIVDDHPVLRKGLAQLIEEEEDMTVCGEAEDTAQALKVVEETQPDILIVDLSLKDSSGLDLIKDMQVRQPKISLLVLSMHEETFYAERVLKAGAKGYITKEEGTEKVVDGIRSVLKGNIYLSENMREKMILKMVGSPGNSEEDAISTLTDRELQIFELIGQGMPTREIAKRLHVSVKTIESHRENIKEKLGVSSATDLLKTAIEWVHSQGNI